MIYSSNSVAICHHIYVQPCKNESECILSREIDQGLKIALVLEWILTVIFVKYYDCSCFYLHQEGCFC